MDPTSPAIDFGYGAGDDPFGGAFGPAIYESGGPFGNTGSFGGGTTISPAAPSADPWSSFFSSFPKFAGGVATIISSTQGKPYAQGPYGASGGYGQNPYGSSALGASGGISTTTLLLIGLALVFFMKK